MHYCKPFLSVILLVTTVVAGLSMLTLMGRKEKSMSVGSLKMLHRMAGWLGVLLVLINSWLCVRYVALIGDGMTVRGALHGLVALGLLTVLLLKLLIVKRYREYLRLAPTLGMLTFALILIVTAASSGFYFARAWWGPGGAETGATVGVAAIAEPGTVVNREADVARQAASEDVAAHLIAEGRAEYMGHCAGCHPTDPDAKGYGPTLPGIFERDVIASSGAPITDASVRVQILAPGGTMPAFEGRLDDEELDEIIAYVKIL